MGAAEPLTGNSEQGCWPLSLGEAPPSCSTAPGFGLCPLHSILLWEKQAAQGPRYGARYPAATSTQVSWSSQPHGQLLAYLVRPLWSGCPSW